MARKYIKIVSIMIILGLFGITTTVFADDTSRKVAEDYIKEIENFGPFWKDRDAKIVKEVPFYTYDDKVPSYIEYKVSCKDDKDCGYVLVNIDGTDVKVPESSTIGLTLSEQMNEKGDLKNKNYYYGLFNHFAVSNTGVISTTSPENKGLDNGENIYSRSGEINPLYEKFQKLKTEVEKNKEKNIKEQEISKYITKSISPIIRNTAGLVNDSYFSNSCKSLTPCYDQGRRTYTKKLNHDNRKDHITIPETKGATGCGPTAMSILFGYYDKYLNENIIDGEAPSLLNKVISSLQKDLGIYMDTVYDHTDGSGVTFPKNITNGFKYLGNNRGIYNHNGGLQIEYNDNTFWYYVENEIKAGRPLLLIYTGHIVVVHGYDSKNNQLVVNFGWGPDSSNKIIDLDKNKFYHKGELKELLFIYLFELY